MLIVIKDKWLWGCDDMVHGHKETVPFHCSCSSSSRSQETRQQTSSLFHFNSTSCSFEIEYTFAFSRNDDDCTAAQHTTAELPHVIVVISIAVSYTSHHQDSLQRRWIGNKWMWHEIGNRNSLCSSLLHCDFHEGWGCVAVDNGAEWALWEFTKREQMQNCGKSRGALKNIFQWLYIQFSKRLISSIDNTSSNDVELKGENETFSYFTFLQRNLSHVNLVHSFVHTPTTRKLTEEQRSTQLTADGMKNSSIHTQSIFAMLCCCCW